MPVPGAGSLDQRVLRVAPAAAQPPGASEPGLEPGDRADPRAVAGDLRGAACAGAAASGRVRRVAAAGSAADAGRRPAGGDPAAGDNHPPGPAGHGGGRPGRREFHAEEPNRLWVADITYVPTAEGFVYLATVLDVFSRKVVGWAMSARQTAALVSSALAMAVDTRASRAVVLHSDRGCQYTALAFTRSCEQARSEIFRFLEGFYNLRRRHLALGYRSPAEFERRWHEQREPVRL